MHAARTDRPPAALSPFRFRIGFVAFLLLLGGIFYWILWGLSPQMRAFQHQEIFYVCEEVVSGDTLVMRPIKGKGVPRDAVVVRVLGIEAPPIDDGPAVAAFAARTGLPEAEVLEMGKISRNTLSVWLYRQSNIMMKFDRDRPRYDDRGRLLAHVELSLVDVGKMQLIEGQATLRDEPHTYTDLYPKYHKKARTKRYGIWRFLD